MRMRVNAVCERGFDIYVRLIARLSKWFQLVLKEKEIEIETETSIKGSVKWQWEAIN